jgi:hypothetical protein
MVGADEQLETMTIERSAILADLATRWRTLCQIQERFAITIQQGKTGTFHWFIPAGYQEDLNIALNFPTGRFTTRIFDGTDEFKAYQLSNILKRKIPTFERARIEQKGRLWEITFDEDPEPLESQVLKKHQLCFRFSDEVITELDFSEWWIPYEKGAILKYGHRINPRIPENEEEAEFPP